MTILRILRVMLFTGFFGSACWSGHQLPTPYPLPFGYSAEALFHCFKLTIIQTHLQASRFTHRYFARWTPVQATSGATFHPRFTD